MVFPGLVQDIYLDDQYFGETVLHMAVANEDPQMVTFLVRNGAALQERASGALFSPEDQKLTRRDCPESLNIEVDTRTNYKGTRSRTLIIRNSHDFFNSMYGPNLFNQRYLDLIPSGLAYMGEYPLSFSACLNQQAAYHIILSAGADPDSVDTNGNSVVHMMVIHNNKEMLNMVYENGASTTLRNRQGFTPLSLAAKFGNKDLFFHILAINQIIYWKVGNIVAAVTPLADLDTINAETGALDTQSALNQVVFGKGINHLSLIDGVIMELLRVKWNVFIKRKFYAMLLTFLSYTFLVTSYMLAENTIVKAEEHHKLLTEIIKNTANLTENLNTSIEFVSNHESEGLQTKHVSEKTLLHFIIFLFSIGFHCEAIYENFYLGSKCLYQTLLLCPSRIIFLLRLANSFFNYQHYPLLICTS